MKNFKKSLSLFLAVIMLLSCGVWSSYAADECQHEYSDELFVVVEPTCHSTGSRARKCLLCGKYDMESQEIMPMLEHTYVLSKRVAPTCSSVGYEIYICSVCHAEKTVNLPALDHKLGEYTVLKEATCTEEGQEEAICSVCGAHKSRPIPKTEHNAVVVRRVPATCTEHGYTEGLVCRDCHKYLVTPQYVKETGHNMVMNTEEEFYIPSTCTQNGRAHLYCMNEHEVYNEETKEYETVQCFHVDYVKLPLADHVDNDGDGKCDECAVDIKVQTCGCFCHHDTFISRIVRFINTLLSKLIKGKDFKCCDDMVPYDLG